MADKQLLLVGREWEEHDKAQHTLNALKELVRDTHECYGLVVVNYYGTYSSINNLVCNLSGCKCCERHQTKRPNHFEQYIRPFDVVPIQKWDHELNCTCKCRLIIRLICRFHDTFVENENREEIVGEFGEETKEGLA